MIGRWQSWLRIRGDHGLTLRGWSGWEGLRSSMMRPSGLVTDTGADTRSPGVRRRPRQDQLSGQPSITDFEVVLGHQIPMYAVDFITDGQLQTKLTGNTRQRPGDCRWQFTLLHRPCAGESSPPLHPKTAPGTSLRKPQSPRPRAI
jgi:hypothetical protein